MPNPVGASTIHLVAIARHLNANLGNQVIAFGCERLGEFAVTFCWQLKT
jgi:hypothetical protein